MQVDPMKSKLKLPATKRLKLNCDEPLSNFAFKLKLCRYTEVMELMMVPKMIVSPQAGAHTRPHLCST